MGDDLRSEMQSMSKFISLEVGESFTGTYLGFKRVINTFDTEKETIELSFEVAGVEKTMTGMSLPRALVENGIVKGDIVTVVKASKKGNQINWTVVKNKTSAPASPAATATNTVEATVKPEITEAELQAAGL